MRSATRVLVIEDYAPARKALCVIAASCGAHVVSAADGKEAPTVAAAEKPTIIFCDIRMPHMDGFEFLRRVRALPGLVAVPVIAMSGLESDADVAQIESAGFAGHLMKPVQVKEIEAYLHTLGGGPTTGIWTPPVK